MSANSQDIRRNAIDTAEPKDDSALQIQYPTHWERKPTRKWRWLAGNLMSAGVVAIAGWLISGSIQQTPSDPVTSTEGFVEQCLLTQMRKAYANGELASVPDTKKTQNITQFRNCNLYSMIFHHAALFEREGAFARIGANDVEEETKIIYFLIDHTAEINDPEFLAGLHKTPEGRRFLEDLPKGAISEDRSTLMVSYARIMTHFNCFIGTDDMDVVVVSDLRQCAAEL